MNTKLDSSDSDLHLCEQRSGDMQGALADPNVDIGFREAMEVTSPGDQQAEVLRKAQILTRLSTCVGAVVDLQAIESGDLEFSDQLD